MAEPSDVVLSTADVVLEIVEVEVAVVLAELDVVCSTFEAFEVDGADALSEPLHATAVSTSATVIAIDTRRTRNRFRRVVTKRP